MGPVGPYFGCVAYTQRGGGRLGSQGPLPSFRIQATLESNLRVLLEPSRTLQQPPPPLCPLLLVCRKAQVSWAPGVIKEQVQAANDEDKRRTDSLSDVRS